MEDGTISDWESEKKIINSRSSNENRFEDTRIYPIENRMLAGNQMTLDEPAGYGQETKPTEEEEEEDTRIRFERGTNGGTGNQKPRTEISSPREKSPPEISGCRACVANR